MSLFIPFAAAAVFLRMNGYKLVVDADEAERFLLEEVIKGRGDVAAISDWLEKLLVDVSTSSRPR